MPLGVDRPDSWPTGAGDLSRIFHVLTSFVGGDDFGLTIGLSYGDSDVREDIRDDAGEFLLEQHGVDTILLYDTLVGRFGHDGRLAYWNLVRDVYSSFRVMPEFVYNNDGSLTNTSLFWAERMASNIERKIVNFINNYSFLRQTRNLLLRIFGTHIAEIVWPSDSSNVSDTTEDPIMIAELEAQLAALATENQTLESQLTQRTMDLDQMRTLVEETRNDSVICSENVLSLENALQLARVALSGAQNQYQEAQNQLRETRSQTSVSQGRVQALEKEVAELNRQIDELEVSCPDVGDSPRYQDVLNQLAILQGILLDRTDELEACRADAGGGADPVLLNQVSTLEQTIVELELQIQNLELEITGYQNVLPVRDDTSYLPLLIAAGIALLSMGKKKK